MQVLSKGDVLNMIREANERRLRAIAEVTTSMTSKSAPSGVQVVGTGLRVRHKKSGLVYTVTGIGHSRFELKPPDDEAFVVTSDELNAEYELD